MNYLDFLQLVGFVQSVHAEAERQGQGINSTVYGGFAGRTKCVMMPRRRALLQPGCPIAPSTGDGHAYASSFDWHFE